MNFKSNPRFLQNLNGLVSEERPTKHLLPAMGLAFLFFGNAGLLAETIILPDGSTYKGVTITATEEGLSITAETGLMKVPIEALSDEQIKQFGLDWRVATSNLRKKLANANADLSSRPRALPPRQGGTPTPRPTQAEPANDPATTTPPPSTAPQPASETPAPTPDKMRAFSLRPDYARLGLDARSQGRKGTCTVFGTVGVIEFHYAKRGNPVELSEQFAAWAANKASGTHKRGYFNERTVIDGIREFGICKEELMPYKAGSAAGTPNKAAREDAETRRSISVTWIHDEAAPGARDGFTTEELHAICGSIADGDPVTIAMKWPNTSRIGKEAVIGMHREKGRSPGHVVVAVGYEKDDKWPGGGRLEIRNSWGQDWADEGYAWITFDFLIENGSSAFAVRAF